jgi:hypothetical protein
MGFAHSPRKRMDRMPSLRRARGFVALRKGDPPSLSGAPPRTDFMGRNVRSEPGQSHEGHGTVIPAGTPE